MSDARRPNSGAPSDVVDPRQQVAAARKSRGQTQQGLADAVNAIRPGWGWKRQTVTALETGEKTFTVEILVAIAEAQQFPYWWYLDGPEPKRGLDVAPIIHGTVSRLARPKDSRPPSRLDTRKAVA